MQTGTKENVRREWKSTAGKNDNVENSLFHNWMPLEQILPASFHVFGCIVTAPFYDGN